MRRHRALPCPRTCLNQGGTEVRFMGLDIQDVQTVLNVLPDIAGLQEITLSTPPGTDGRVLLEP